MKLIRFLMAASLCVLAAFAHADDKMMTRFGQLRVVQSNKEFSQPDKLVLGKRTVMLREMEYISIYQKFEIGNQDVVLVGVNCGGSGCPNDDLSLIVLEANTPPRELTEKNFSSNDGTVKPRLDEQQRLVIDLGFENRKRKVAVYDGTALKVGLLGAGATTTKPMSKGDCEWLYEYGSNSCITAKDSDPGCRDPQSTFPGVTMRGVAAMSNHPGFQGKKFDAACVFSCKTGKQVPYAAFRKEVCSQP